MDEKTISWRGMKKLLVFVLVVDLLLILGAIKLKAGFRAAEASQRMLERAVASRHCRKAKGKAVMEELCGAPPASWHFLPFRTRYLHHAYVRCLEGYVSHRETKVVAKTQLLVGLFPLLVAFLLFLVIIVFLRPLYNKASPSPSIPSFEYPRFERRPRRRYGPEDSDIRRQRYGLKEEPVEYESSTEQ